MAEKPQKPWGRKTSELPGYVMDSLYQISHFLGKQTRTRLGLMMEIPVFIKDPLEALDNPLLGVQEITMRLEIGMSDGPTSSLLSGWVITFLDRAREWFTLHKIRIHTYRHWNRSRNLLVYFSESL